MSALMGVQSSDLLWIWTHKWRRVHKDRTNTMEIGPRIMQMTFKNIHRITLFVTFVSMQQDVNHDSKQTRVTNTGRMKQNYSAMLDVFSLLRSLFSSLTENSMFFASENFSPILLQTHTHVWILKTQTGVCGKCFVMNESTGLTNSLFPNHFLSGLNLYVVFN